MRRLSMIAVWVGMSTSALAQTANLPEAHAVPQTQAPVLAGVAQTRVRTLHLDAKGHTVPAPAAVPAPSAAASLAPLLPPTVKVPLYRVEPNGTMHAPAAPTPAPARR